MVHVDKLMPYQPDFGEELESWLRDEESGGCRAKGTQTPMPALPETPPEVTDEPSVEVNSSPHDPGPESILAQIREMNLLNPLPHLDVATDPVRSQTDTRKYVVCGLCRSPLTALFPVSYFW